jgi:hypothetical protein
VASQSTVLGQVSNWSFIRANWPGEILQSQNPFVTVVTARADMSEIARLRYELYVARDRKPYKAADHAQRSFVDAIDATSLNFQAVDHSILLASVRLTSGRDALRDPQTAHVVEAFGMAPLDAISVTSRFVVRPTLASRRFIVPLFQETFRCGLILGFEHNLLATRLELRGIFERFGFRMTGRRFDDPVAGLLHIFHLDVHDRSHLAKVDSPFLEITRENAYAEQTQ